MAEMNLQQIINKLNTEFTGDVRKLVFWYDSSAEFISYIDAIKLTNAKLLILEPDNQFRTKYFLEREDKTTNYLIYAPFPKPSIKENHLADTIRYSKEFSADRISLIMMDLGIEEKYRPMLQRYKKFFAAKDRTNKFYEQMYGVNQSMIEIGLMSIICKAKHVSFEEVVRSIITDEDFENSKYLDEFSKYGLSESFWKMCTDYFGYTEIHTSVNKLIYMLFITYAVKMIDVELSLSLQPYQAYKSGNVMAFLDGLMNSVVYRERFDDLSEFVYRTLNLDTVFRKVDESNLVELELFKEIDIFLLQWLLARLENEDTSAKLNGYSIPEICRIRRKMHFGSTYSSHYYVIENAYYLILAAQFEPRKTAQEIWESYITDDYKIDQRYRYFYYHYDRLEDSTPYESLRILVENIYTNRYLNPLAVAWSRAFALSKVNTGLMKQQDFYKKYIKNSKERTVVIISDALRFEVGQTLMKRLQEDEKCTATITAMQAVLPSHTAFGMSALLPHKELSMTQEGRVLLDGQVCDDVKAREQVLQKYVSNSKVARFDEIRTVREAKELTTAQDVVYIYHNQIDARGDKLNTENEVFTACQEAVDEIYAMIRRLTSANNIRFVITADHGFIYKRDKLNESDKISGFDRNDKDRSFGRRYAVAKEKINADGIAAVTLDDIIGNGDQRVISFPIGSDVFKMTGGGQNFVHGGASPQELIIPVIDVKTNKYHMETKAVGIAVVSLVTKITNLTMNLDFIQTDAVNDVNKETVYRIFFISEDNERISNENLYVADKKEQDGIKRMFRLKFMFKNKQYDRQKKYYLVINDEKNDFEVLRHEVQMDLAFVDDFGFNT